MNDLIKEQLDKCTGLDIIQISETQFHIKKQDKIPPSLMKLNHCYLIEVSDIILNQTQINSTLVSNWNNGQTVKDKYIKISFTKQLNTMYRFDGVGFNIQKKSDTTNYYSDFWLPGDQFTILQEIIY